MNYLQLIYSLSIRIASWIGAGIPGTENIDLALSENSKFLYSLNTGDRTIAVFRVNQDGSLIQ